MKNLIKTLLLLLPCTFTQAGVINGGALLTDTDANQLETWLGVGDQDFTNIWSGTNGVGTAASFHSAVDAAGPTFAIYEITLNTNEVVRVGGYTGLSWGGAGYAHDSSAFLFNLDTLEAQFTQHSTSSIYRNGAHFATFGGGHDLYGGANTLGNNLTSLGSNASGYSFSYTYDQNQGQITRAGDSGYGSGSSGIHYNAWYVNSLEMYTFSAAAPVSAPEPGSLLLLALSLAGIGFRKKAKQV